MKPNDLLPKEFADATGGWDEFFRWARTRRGFAFRGQADQNWPVWSWYHRCMDQIARARAGNTSEEETMIEPDSEYLIDLYVVAHELYPELEQEFDLETPNKESSSSASPSTMDSPLR